MGLRTVFIANSNKSGMIAEFPEIIFGDQLFYDLAFNHHGYSDFNFEQIDGMTWIILVTKEELIDFVNGSCNDYFLKIRQILSSSENVITRMEKEWEQFVGGVETLDNEQQYALIAREWY